MNSPSNTGPRGCHAPAAEREQYAATCGHPCFWSGLMLSGPGGSLSLDGEAAEVMPWWGYLLSAVLVVAALVYFLRVLRSATAYEK